MILLEGVVGCEERCECKQRRESTWDCAVANPPDLVRKVSLVTLRNQRLELRGNLRNAECRVEFRCGFGEGALYHNLEAR
jgi:hypothetical protein